MPKNLSSESPYISNPDTDSYIRHAKILELQTVIISSLLNCWDELGEAGKKLLVDSYIKLDEEFRIFDSIEVRCQKKYESKLAPKILLTMKKRQSRY